MLRLFQVKYVLTFHQPNNQTQTRGMTQISQEIPAIPFSLNPIEDEAKHPKARSAKEVKQEILGLEEEIQNRKSLIAASSRTSRDMAGIDINKLAANGSSEVIRKARERLVILNEELANINSAVEVEKVTE